MPVDGTLRCNDIRALREAALLGLGLAILPRSLVDDDLRQDRLRIVLPEASTRELSIWAIFPSRHVPAKSRVFVQHVEAALRRTPWGH